MGFDPNSAEENTGSLSLVFNGGKAGVANGCKVKISKKSSSDSEKKPEYKIEAWDVDQVVNSSGVDEDKIYPVNKGFFYMNLFDENLDYQGNRDKGNFTSKKAENFMTNELKHLLKTFGHDVDEKGQIIFKSGFDSFRDYMDYVMDFCNKAIKADPSLSFDIVVDYGNEDYPKSFLQMNGYPWYIAKTGGSFKIQNSNKALMDRPVQDKGESSPFNSGDSSTETKDWLNS